MTALLDHHLLCHAHVRLDRLRIDSGKQGIHFGANLDVLDSALSEDAGKHSTSGAVHGVDQELESGGADLVEIGELLDGFDIGSFEIGGGDCSLLGTYDKGLVQ